MYAQFKYRFRETNNKTVMDTNFAILNPQDKIPDVASKFTVVKDEISPIDLNEDEWSKEYFVIFFHNETRTMI